MNAKPLRLLLLLLGLGSAAVQAQREQPGQMPAPATPATATPGADGLQPGPQVLAKPAALSDFEKRFLTSAAHANAAELDASRLLLERSDDVDLKNFAQLLVREHGESQRQLKQLAATKRVNLPQGASPEDEKALDELRARSGEALNREYLQRFGVQSHRQSLALFERAANQARDPDVKRFAESMLPTLRRHLEMAERLARTPNRAVPPAVSQSAPALTR